MRAGRSAPSAVPAVLTVISLLFVVFSVWELLRLGYFVELDTETVHWLYLSRGAASALILGAWALWWVFRSRARFESRLRDEEVKCRGLLDSFPDAVVFLDDGGRVVEWNPGAERLFNLTSSEVRGLRLAELREDWAPELAEVVSVAARGAAVRPFLARRRVRGGGLQEMEYRVAAVASPGGSSSGVAIVARDLTEQRAMEAQITNVEKLAGVGRLAAGVAHQLGTPLSTIGLNARMIGERTADPEVREDARVILEAASHCGGVVGELLRFARPSGGDHRRLRLGSLVGAAVHMVEREIRQAGVGIELETAHDAEVVGDRGQIEQVVINLLTNARQATPAGGLIRVKVSNDGDSGALLEVSDTGHGIREEDLPRVFDPFFTTREAQGGHGLGLAVCFRIVRDHGGVITADGAPGRGARFSVWLPAAGKAP